MKLTTAAASCALMASGWQVGTATATSPSDMGLFSSQHLYDWGWYGGYPMVNYKSFHLPAPHVNFLAWDERCDNGYYLLTPKGRFVVGAGPMILDARGELVWNGHGDFGKASDLQSQTFKGKQYLTFWKDLEGAKWGWGRGQYVMLDEHYEVFRTFQPVGDDLMGDLHEFHITPEGTVLLTAYDPRPADLSPIGGPAEGWIIDSLFQELDVETGDLLFEWRASDHIKLEDCIRYFAGRDDGLSPEKGFDYFHINSMDKDKDGNYIISGRHTQTIHAINPKDGSVIWTLGGTQNMFKDLSDGKAIDFTYQHHIRIDDRDIITMFDNAKAERDGPATPYDYSRGLVIQLDPENLTAELLHEIWDPDHPKWADSQGSAQLWDDGKSMLVGYGHCPTFTEFDTETSEVLCDVRIGPWLYFKLGTVGSYRAFKGHWKGMPKRRPGIFLNPAEETIFVSWNGATEVAKWVLQGADYETVWDGPWTEVTVQDKTGFETGIRIDSSMPKYLRAVAVSATGEELGHTEVLNREVGNVPPLDILAFILSIVDTITKIVMFCAILWTWDYTRPFRKRFVSWLLRVSQAAGASKLCRWCLPRRSSGKSFLSLPRWMGGSKKGNPHELQPLYKDDDSDV